MRLAYLSGYEKKFYGCLYKALAAGYDKFPSDDVLEAICKYVMKGDPRKQVYFRWFLSCRAERSENHKTVRILYGNNGYLLSKTASEAASHVFCL